MTISEIIEFKLYYVFSLEDEYMQKYYPNVKLHKRGARSTPFYKELRDSILNKEPNKRLQDMPLGLLKRELNFLRNYGSRCPNSNPEVQAQRKATCLERYGDENYNNTEKQRETVKAFSKEKRDDITKRRRATNIAKYGDAVHSKKAVQTRISHYGKFNLTGKHESKASVKIYNYLVDRFGVDDVIKEYTDSRYARKDGYCWKCDFYVISEDLFIEYHGHQTHNFKLFEPNNIHHIIELKRLEYLDKNAFAKDTARVWQIDREKYDTAMRNKLNYITIYPNDNIEDCFN